MTRLPCECTSLDEIDWETNVTNFEHDGECDLQPGECPCGNTYYKRWDLIGVTTEDGSMVADYTSRF